MINVINFLDGLDGLASGISLIATIILYFLAIKPEVNQMSMSVLAIVLAGALIGFLPFNFYPAKVFLGDSGSQVLGFLLATFAIISGGKLATAFLVLGVPILDVVWVIARRVLAHKPVYQADRFHLHHRLLEAGLQHRGAVLLLYTISAAFGLIALETQTLGKLIAAIVLTAIMVLGGIVLVTLAARKVKIR
jgi:UDP-N-acetylmuramyl pentapeptide phosphotransferase/UDP-N-acetylglucosamine-1-phosphate transferase